MTTMRLTNTVNIVELFQAESSDELRINCKKAWNRIKVKNAHNLMKSNFWLNTELSKISEWLESKTTASNPSDIESLELHVKDPKTDNDNFSWFSSGQYLGEKEIPRTIMIHERIKDIPEYYRKSDNVIALDSDIKEWDKIMTSIFRFKEICCQINALCSFASDYA